MTDDLRKRIAAAISDPGHSGEGYKGERTLTEWQTDAVMRTIAKDCQCDPALIGIAEQIKESGGGWKPCSGCYDTEDGHPTRKYDHSPALRTDIGCGCHECGGLGAVWEYYSEADIAALQAEFEGESR